MLLRLLLTAGLFLGQEPERAMEAGGGALASAERHATAAGAAILAAGGNAIDAAVATGFALAVTHPTAGNLGGGGFLLLYQPGAGAAFLDFREVAPAAATESMYLDEGGQPLPRASRQGWLACGVPGSVPGMLEALDRWGTMPRERVIAPAIALARDGFVIEARLASAIKRAEKRLVEDPLAAAVFLDANGAPLEVGERLFQPALAATLERISRKGATAFREGELVGQVVAHAREHGGVLSLDDFASYRPVLREAWEFDWRGYRVITSPPPSSAGPFLELTLRELERYPLVLYGPRSAKAIERVASTTARAFRVRNRWLGDPATMEVDARQLVDAILLDGGLAGAELCASLPSSEGDNTTHYSVVDGDGLAVSVTTTLNSSFGAAVMAPGGFLMNNEMDDFAVAPGRPNQFGLVQSRANRIVAGRRPLSSMSPTILLSGGRVESVVGSPGGPTILTTVLQVVLNRHLYGMSPRAAVDAPRYHRQDVPLRVLAEPHALPPGLATHFHGQGIQPKRVKRLGDVNAVFRVDSGWLPIADDCARP